MMLFQDYWVGTMFLEGYWAGPKLRGCLVAMMLLEPVSVQV